MVEERTLHDLSSGLGESLVLLDLLLDGLFVLLLLLDVGLQLDHGEDGHAEAVVLVDDLLVGLQFARLDAGCLERDVELLLRSFVQAQRGHDAHRAQVHAAALVLLLWLAFDRLIHVYVEGGFLGNGFGQRLLLLLFLLYALLKLLRLQHHLLLFLLLLLRPHEQLLQVRLPSNFLFHHEGLLNYRMLRLATVLQDNLADLVVAVFQLVN